MSRGGIASALGGIAIFVASLWAPGAYGASLVGDYQLQGTRASSGPGPALTDIAAGNAFQTDTVMGVVRQVLAFPPGSGLQMSPAGLGGDPDYSVVVTFRFTTALAPPQDYARILDSTDGNADTGLYDHLGHLDFFDVTDYQSASPLFADNTYATVALVVDSAGTRGYFNGVLNSSYPALYAVPSDTLRFFKDDVDEESAGAVSCIRVYRGALTDAEIAGVGASPSCGTVASGTVATPAPTCKGKPATIVGTEGRDVRNGTSGKDVIVGLGGNDKLNGLAGNDLICGGVGKDILTGGKGNDMLFGEAGKDTLKGGPGKDELKGGAGKDKQVQ